MNASKPFDIPSSMLALMLTAAQSSVKIATMTQPQLPIPISRIQDSFLLFDIDAIAWLRANGQICGAFIGTLHQNPSQNVFLGLPLEIVPEEVNHLVAQGICYVVDDARAHDEMLDKTNKRKRDEYLARLDQQVNHISKLKAEEREAHQKQMKSAALKKKAAAQQSVATDEDIFGSDAAAEPPERMAVATDTSPRSDTVIAAASPQDPEHFITPTTTTLLYEDVAMQTRATTAALGFEGARNALTSYFHNSESPKYFLHPGLRFGAHYSVYPGDPLRYHSHFLARAVDWEEDIDLMDIVGGGRLGTGVKKAYLLGGKQPAANPVESENDTMRLFSIEWAVM